MRSVHVFPFMHNVVYELYKYVCKQIYYTDISRSKSLIGIDISINQDTDKLNSFHVMLIYTINTSIYNVVALVYQNERIKHITEKQVNR